MEVARIGHRLFMSRRNVQIRPLGGGPGCLALVVVSILASVFLTVLLNALMRL